MKNLTKIELYKNFRQPITITGIIILSILMIVLVFFYSPTKIEHNDDSYNLDSTNITTIYNQYKLEILPEINLKTKDAEEILTYYSNIKQRNDNIQTYKNEVINNYERLDSVIFQGNNNEINSQCIQLKNALERFENEILNFNNLENINYIYNISIDYNYINNSSFANLSKLIQQINNNQSNTNWGRNTFTLLSTNNYENILNDCAEDSINFINFVLNKYKETIQTNYNDYINYIDNTKSSLFNINTANNHKNNLHSTYLNFRNIYNSLFEYDFDIIIYKTEVLENINIVFNNLNNLLLTSTTNRSTHTELIKQLKETNFVNNINDFINNFTIIALDNDTVDELNQYFTTVSSKSAELDSTISNYYNKNNINEMTNAIKKQITLNNLFVKLINNSVTISCFDDYDTYKNYLDESKIYNSQCEITFAKYCIDNNSYPVDVNNNYQFNYQVNENIDCYDYITFALKIATSIIIIISLILSCQAIAGEHKNGMLRFTLTSPYTRGQIYSSKIISTVIISSIMLAISLIISLITGLIKFGIPQDYNIITIFNATTILSFHPIVSIIIFFICQLIVILSYISLIYFFSCAIKSFIGAISGSIIFTGITFALAKINSPIMSIIPTNNFDLSKYFYLYEYSTSGNILHTLFDVTQYSIQNFFVSIIITILTIIVINIINKTIFKKQSY